MTIKIEAGQLEKFTLELLQGAGLNPANARTMTNVYMRATLRGVGHHDIYDLMSRLRQVEKGQVNPNPNITLLQQSQAVESYDGDNGLGEICCSFVMERAMQLAEQFGIGFCTVRRSNHFLAAAPYVEQAAERNFLGMVFTRAGLSMGAPGADRTVAGNNPFGFAAMSNEGFPLMLDISMAYSSYGKLHEKVKTGESVPEYWGMDANHRPTTDPKAILDGGVINPVAGHKGFGLSLLGEILTGLLSGGEMLDETSPASPNPYGSAQTAIVLKVDALMPPEHFKQRVSDLIHRIHDRAPAVQMPGQHSFENKKQALAGGLELEDELVSQLNGYAAKFKISPLTGQAQE